MADSSSPSKIQSLFPLETCPHVNDEAFNLFHSIDRELFTRLIKKLGRDPAESVQVMAFWLWLERESSDMNLIKRMLSLPPHLVNEVADETTACLKCVESDNFVCNNVQIRLLPELLNNPVASLRFFHENRTAVVRGVSKVVNTVCLRAFGDILHRVWRENAAATLSGGNGGPAGVPVHHFREVAESSRDAERRGVGVGGGGGMGPPSIMPPMMYNPYVNVPMVPVQPGGGLIRMPAPRMPSPHVAAAQHLPEADAVRHPIHMLPTGGLPTYDLAAQRHNLNNDLGEMLSRHLTLREGNVGGRDQEVPQDDRTIFLTFSKGYPTSEEEVREFFTKKFGDFIEGVIMQEVGEDEQVLYARMVAKTPGVIDGIVGGNKAKYSINGKHVWARKYVKKPQSKSPPRGDSTAAP